MKAPFASALAVALFTPIVAAQERGGDEARLPDGAKVYRNLEYVPGGHERQKLDLFLPAKTNGGAPLIIWIHGGAWSGGSKADSPARHLVNDGYAVASINYRLSQHAIFPAQIEDCKAAVRWLRAHAKEYHLDPDYFGAWGSSAGGHLVALLGTTGGVKEFDRGENLDTSSRVQAVVDYFGPTDFLRMDEQAGARGAFKHNAPDSPESRLIGGTLQENKDKAARANPIAYVSKDNPPMLIVHGDADPLVPYQQSELLHEALQKAGVESTLRIIPGGGHGDNFGMETITWMKRFFERHLKPGGTEGKK